ncbi:MAG TPA: HAMP domain-containing sensor histidine kinase [Oscillospiraceae bacterium]|nr:HAMP domain-containing histidine kinase [Oscillospiraceae bacterium]HPV99482.1 HAMP domain-containing sensor histidine kinase [Oscillospiraceae bacterium]
MKTLTGKLWAKTLAFLLVCLLVPVAFGSGLGLYYGYEKGWYSGKEMPFTESDWCHSCTYDNLYRIADRIYYEGAAGAIGALAESPNLLDEGFSYVILTEDGKPLADTTTDGAVRVAAITAGVLPPENGGPGDAESGVSYTVEGYVTLPVEGGAFYTADNAYRLIYGLREEFLPISAGSLPLLILLFVYLMAAAGHKDGEDGVVLAGHNRVPLDLYAGLCVLAGIALFGIANELFFYRGNLDILSDFIGGAILLLGWSVICLAFCMTAAARLKAGRWWRNTVVYAVLAFVFGLISGFFKALPVVWKTAVSASVFLLVNMIFAGVAFGRGSFFPFFLLLMMDFAALCALIAVALQLRILQKAGNALAEGNLEYQVDSSKLWLDFKTHGRNLNSISLGMAKAVDERLRSERFKTELITNVSHDLKTPLTSIVSYIDLLKKEDLQNETAREYIDVLDRQSAKLKKLTEDLVDASKASSGAIAVNKELLDLAELVGQSVGEYAEKFGAAGLEPVIGLPEEGAAIRADGRLLWRVLDNLLQNTLKYALPGTRIYIDLKKSYGKAVLTLKNISRESLNIPAEELMERFIRGDSSRSTEGSGLGLSIAKSLTEQMGGNLNLYLDGDLFKVALVFTLEQQ